jgi:hypothetical protein
MHCICFMGIVVAAVVDEYLECLRGVNCTGRSHIACKITYVASNVHVVCGLSVSPDHSIRREMRLHARGLPCEDNSAIRRRIREVGPGNGRGVAHYLWALDEMFERFCGLKGS